MAVRAMAENHPETVSSDSSSHDLIRPIIRRYATLGQIGFEGRFHYGAIGTVLNLASRLCDAAKAGQILLTQRVHADVEDIADVEPVGDLELKGFAKPVPTLNLLALKEGAT